MRPINVSLDSVTWELAKAKPNFSQWVRDQLRSEDNKRKESQQRRKNTRRNVFYSVEDHDLAKTCIVYTTLNKVTPRMR